MAKEGSIFGVLNNNAGYVNKLYEQLSSGKRINSAKDDSAGLAIMNALEASTTTLSMGVRNSNDGLSALSIAGGALEQLGDITIRMRELATQSANGTLSDAQRESLNKEYQALAEESQRIVDTTNFNEKNLLTKDGFIIQSGNTRGDESQTIVGGMDIPSSIQTIANKDISTKDGALEALSPLEDHLNKIMVARADLGTIENRLVTDMRNSMSRIENEEEALGRIQDANIADTVSKLTSANIRNDFTTAMFAQSNNLQKDMVAKLLG